MDNSSIRACLGRSVSWHQLLLHNLLLDFLGRVYSSIPLLHTSLFYLFEPDLPINSLSVAEFVEVRTPD